jgi:hypothetical protein
MRTALVVNCSTPHYNLGAQKLCDWLFAQGYDVCYVNSARDLEDLQGLWIPQVDLVCLSVIFSWNALIARSIALRMKDETEIQCGGPGMFALASWWRRETGLEIVKGLDQRFDKQRGNYKMTFASRGCPVNCSFCIVPRLEGLTFSYDPDFSLAHVLCDNNLSALPVEYQEHIIRRYQETDTALLDANSGFEPRYFDEGTYERWKTILRGPWRFALDEMREMADVERMMTILKQESPKKKRVYVLVGNEPIAVCHERAMKVIEWGGEPHCQFVLPLNWLGDPSAVKLRYDWVSYQQGRDFCRFFNRYLWRYISLKEYNNRKHEAPPFAAVAL